MTGKGFIPNVSNHNKPNNGFIKISGRGWNNRDPTKNKEISITKKNCFSSISQNENNKKAHLAYPTIHVTKTMTWVAPTQITSV